MAQLHEYQAKEILSRHGVEIPRGEVAFDPAQAQAIAQRLGGRVVVKAQIHSTSRAASGGIKFAKTADEAERLAAEMLGADTAGNRVEAILIDERADIKREFYLGYIVDANLKRPTLLFSEWGGSGVETRAASMRTFVCSVRREPDLMELKKFAFQVAYSSFLESKVLFGEESGLLAARLSLRLAEILLKLYRVAKSCEARTAEINPLALLEDGRLVALDARISVDDYAVYRHEDLGIEMARELGHTPTPLERIAWEVERDDFRGTFYFVEILNSYQSTVISQQNETDNCSLLTDNCLIGFHGAGGGGSMASLDAAQRNGLAPACYVDTSGNPPASKIYRAAKIILSIPGIRGYFLSGSGVASQEQFGLARAVIKAFRETRPNIPAVLRLGGNGEDYAKELIEKYTGDLPAPVEAYQKKHSADFCAARLKELIESGQWSVARSVGQNESEYGGKLQTAGKIQNQVTDRRPPTTNHYSFKTRTGEIIYDHAVFAARDAAPIVEACPVKILKLDERRLPVLAITPEEAERGKCVECLACEFASWEYETGGVEINLPVTGLEKKTNGDFN